MKKTRNIISIVNLALLLILLVFMTPTTLNAEEQHILGRWCDSILPNTNQMNRVITISLSKKGILVAKIKYFDGSMGNDELTDLGNGMFRINGSPSGDKYRIVPNNGELQMLDNDGLIRTARRLESLPHSGDCLP